MNNRIVRIGLAAVAVVALVVIGIVLLTGCGTGAQLTPSSAQAQSLGNTTPDPFVGTWQMHNSDPGYNGLRLVISKPDGQYWVLSDSPGLTQYTWEAFTRQGDQLSADVPLGNPYRKGRLVDVRWVRLSVTEVPGQLLERYDGTDLRGSWQATMAKVSDSTATPTPAP